MMFRRYLVLVVMMFTYLPLFAADPVYTSYFNDRAIGGHDAVAYFTESRSVEGLKKFTSQYMGAEFRFSSQENKTLFDAEPMRYAPQYGGYCAWAVSQGYTASGDPDQWTIVDGKLYLNYDQSVSTMWKKDIPGFINSANKNWPALLAE